MIPYTSVFNFEVIYIRHRVVLFLVFLSYFIILALKVFFVSKFWGKESTFHSVSPSQKL